MRDRSGNLRLLAGGLLIIGAMFLLVPGINSVAAIVYKNSEQAPSYPILALGAGGLVFLTGLVLMVAGLMRRRSYRKRVTTYGDTADPADPSGTGHNWTGGKITAGQVEAHLQRAHRRRQ